jgi:L-fucose mutarotase/ribose pyranase (RbsD/FucU family)
MFKESMINNISTYLEAYIDEAIPAQKLTEAVKSKKAQIVLEQIKEILGIDTAIAKKAVRDAIIDGKSQIDEANKKLEAAQKELRQIKEEYSHTSSELVLEKRLATVEGKKKDYLKKVLKGKSPSFIKENFEYASNLFDKSESERLQTLKEEAITESTSQKVDRPVVEESNEQFQQHSTEATYMNPYLKELSKF